MKPPVRPRRIPATAVAGALFVGLVLHHQWTAPAWVPGGADWDTWYLGAGWFRGFVQEWPAARWPAWGALHALVDLLTPGVPTHVAGTLTGLLCLAVTGAATFDLGRRLMGPAAGGAAAALVVTLPLALELGSWTSGYPAWMAAGALGAAGLAAAADGERRGFLAAGVGTALCWALLPKAVGGAIGLTGLGVLVALGRRDLRGPGLFLGPVVAAGLAYLAFPAPLYSFEDQVRLTLSTGGAGIAPIPGGADPALTGDGYVFGKQMGPLLDTLRSGAGRAGAHPDWNRLARAFPDVLPWTAGWLGVGVLAAAAGVLRGPRRGPRLVGWVALLGLAASVAPVPLAADPQIRFLAPLPPIVALLFLAPVAAWRAPGGRGALPAAVGVLLLAFLPPSPLSALWTHPAELREEMSTGRADTATRIWHDLDRGWPERPVVVYEPMRGGLFAVQDRPGFMVGPGEPLPRPITAEDLLLVTSRAHPELGTPAPRLGSPPVDDPAWAQRIVTAAWEAQSGGHHVVLVEVPPAPRTESPAP